MSIRLRFYFHFLCNHQRHARLFMVNISDEDNPQFLMVSRCFPLGLPADIC